MVWSALAEASFCHPARTPGRRPTGVALEAADFPATGDLPQADVRLAGTGGGGQHFSMGEKASAVM